MSISSQDNAAITKGKIRPRVIWLQNQADHYFVRMLDLLNSKGDVEYFGVFLCPPPTGNVLYQLPKNSPYIFLGNPLKHAGPGGHKRLGVEARAYIKNLEFSAVIIGGYDSHFKRWVLRYCQSHGIPIALFADSNIRFDRGRGMKKQVWRFAKRIFLQSIISSVDRIIPCNHSGVAYWRYYGASANKIFRSTYFCAVDASVALMTNREDLFNRYKLDAKCKFIFTAARLVPVKALHLMVQAFKESKLAEQGWVWGVAGDGPLRRDLEKQAGELNGNAIRFLGPVAPEDIPALMAQSELFVLPSTYEPHGIVVTEAMAVGTPVIAGDCCGAARDLVKRGRTGWLFKNGDAADLGQILMLATKYQEQLRTMRPVCQEHFVNWYQSVSPPVVIPQIVEKWIKNI